jgi:hypothetical protein
LTPASSLRSSTKNKVIATSKLALSLPPARVAVALGTGRKLRPVQAIEIGEGESEHEIVRKALAIAFDLFV